MMQAARRAVVAGSGPFAYEVAEVAADCGFVVVGFIEGLDPQRTGAGALPSIVWIEDQREFEPGAALIVGAGSVARQGFVERLVQEGRSLAVVVHPSAHVGASAELEAGVVVFPGAVIGAETVVGLGTIINRGALVGHHTTIGPHSFIGPGANIAGLTTIGRQVSIGMGAIVRDHVVVGDRAVVGAGAVVVEDVAAGITVVGLPARPMERDRG